jgi:predicted nucleic acid-binding protein
MRIVCDTGPLIGLAKIDCLYILKDIAEEVCIPPMVYRELFGKVSTETERIENALNDFIQITELKTLKPQIQEMLSDLAEGERQAIGLASLFSKDVLLLIDDLSGRRVADKLNIPKTGLIGILLLAKERRILKDIGSLLDDLRTKGYWISDELTVLARRLAGEYDADEEQVNE